MGEVAVVERSQCTVLIVVSEAVTRDELRPRSPDVLRCCCRVDLTGTEDLAVPGRPGCPVNGLLRDQMAVRHEKYVARALQNIWCTLCSVIGLNPVVWFWDKFRPVASF